MDPPLTGVAVNVTEVPEQIVEEEAPIETDGVSTGFTVIAIVLLVAVFVVKHVALLVSLQETISLFVKAVLVNDAEFDPAFTPSIIH